MASREQPGGASTHGARFCTASTSSNCLQSVQACGLYVCPNSTLRV